MKQRTYKHYRSRIDTKVEKDENMKYMVMIEIDTGEYHYVTGNEQFNTGDNPKLFDTLCEAQQEANKWNTGVVVPVHGGKNG